MTTTQLNYIYVLLPSPNPQQGAMDRCWFTSHGRRFSVLPLLAHILLTSDGSEAFSIIIYVSYVTNTTVVQRIFFKVIYSVINYLIH